MPQKREPQTSQEREENPSAFKHSIGPEHLKRVGQAIKLVHPAFDRKAFEGLASELKSLELKPRVRRVREELRRLLPADYKAALQVLLASVKAEKIRGFDLWPYTDFVQTYGLEDLKRSLDALSVLTRLFTAEFAVRPFLSSYPEPTFAYLLTCASSPDLHLRRWASEGSRPRLPWGERLSALVADPSPTRPILEALKFDSELYVRKSVANHLNDIAKDHPDYVIKLLLDWRKAASRPEEAERIVWITKHALRSLIKSGYPKALKAIGVDSQAKVALSRFKLAESRLAIGETLDFMVELRSESPRRQKLVVDYAIHYVKANGKTSPKVFKWKTFELGAMEKVRLEKTHVLREVTTRVHYPGRHALSVQVNGVVVKTISWDLF